MKNPYAARMDFRPGEKSISGEYGFFGPAPKKNPYALRPSPAREKKIRTRSSRGRPVKKNPYALFLGRRAENPFQKSPAR